MNTSTHSHGWIIAAAAFGALGVIIGAFGAHALPTYLVESGLSTATVAEREATFETGVRYHMYHALALLWIGSMARQHRSLSIAAWAFVLGMLVFSGCLYANAVTGIKWLGIVVPVGGLSFILGWTSIAVAFWRRG